MAVDVVPLDGQVQNGRCCICSRFVALEALYLTHMGVMPGVVCLAVLLRRFLWHAGSQKIVHCVIQYTDKTNTNSLRLVDSLSHTRRPYQSASSHTSLPKRVRPLPSPTQAQQAMPSSQRACLNLRSRLAATAAGQVPRIHDSPSDDPGCFTSKPKRSYPGPWLASAATPITRQYWGDAANTLYFLVICIAL